MALSDFFSSFMTTIYADSEEKATEPVEETEPVAKEEPAAKEESAAEEEPAEEEEDPEDQPVIRDECKEKKCAQLAAHFEHCQEKVQSGKGFQHEDCVEELYVMMHCIDDCAAPKLFSKLR
ncbi:QCR6 subunit 6 of the ubiquinol cytochrome-c reductase complex [Agaricus bisporus var. burnettii JB137-S8]|uniref:QCR6 subunit 6 of the ubiquinol cytochrome-c reductase complex n=1 Tax=Agaricus bisporus var. burnettii (strain JB137-S8 / ATCC MYA-4627 / FGSC 10392) TaxID=597362 RepID=K5XJU8_AGABU|nr:QCR6 subunit 6 of the ubiquinol cytochrome-c reductase complex [Agaricus bisporus var. burnettii JB137-S8]EKM74780.1 QCR6 subunit 6 of the ubiquinol cytochrome-c reductase complex [Agaricus bisporus var. burnettii JB137-S8]